MFIKFPHLHEDLMRSVFHWLDVGDQVSYNITLMVILAKKENRLVAQRM